MKIQKKHLFVHSAVCLLFIAGIFMACAPATGNDSTSGNESNSGSDSDNGSNQTTSDISSLANTTWLYKDVDSHTEKPASTSSGSGSGSGANSGSNTGDNTGSNTGTNTGSNTGSNTGDNTGSNTGDNTGTNTNTGSGTGGGASSGSTTENKTYTFTYVHFDNEGYAFFGTVTWTDVLSGGVVQKTGTKKYSPEYCGTYTLESGAITFTFDRELYTYLDNNYWIDMPHQSTSRNGSIKTTIEYTKSTEEGPAYYGLYSSSQSDTNASGTETAKGIMCTATTSNLYLKHNYSDGGYAAYQQYTWDKDSYDLSVSDMTVDGTKAKMTTIDLASQILVSDNTTTNESAFYSFISGNYGAAVKSTGTLFKNVGDIYKNYQNTYAVKDATTSDCTWIRRYANTVLFFNPTTYSFLPKMLTCNDDATAFTVDGAEYKKLDAATYKIFATDDEAKTIGMASSSRSYYYDVGADSELSKFYKAYPTLDTSGVTGYSADKDWCYQNATYYGPSKINPEISLAFTKSGSGVYSYELSVGIANVTMDTIDHVLPGRFSVTSANVFFDEVTKAYTTHKWWTVTLNSAATTTGENVVTISDGSRSYALSYMCCPYVYDTITANADLKLKSLFMLPSENIKLDARSVATIDESTSAITLYVNNDVDMTKGKFHYEGNSADTELTITKSDGSTVEASSYSKYDLSKTTKITISKGAYSHDYTFSIVKGADDGKITFDLNNGKGTLTTTVGYYSKVGFNGFDASTPTKPTADGYEFNGWNTKQDGTGVYAWGADEQKGDLTLYAIWVEN